MNVTVVGDFADPMSFLASQRVEQITSLGLADINWLAVESDRLRPMAGRPLDQATADTVRQFASPGEIVATAGVNAPNSRAATAAYAESLTDGVPDAMRRALFDALWVRGQRVDDPNVIRGIVFRVLNPNPPGDIDARIRANQPIVPLGDPDPTATTRRLGFIVSMGRGPLTVDGQRRIDAWARLWHDHGDPPLPLLLTDLDEAYTGEHALQWLAALLPHRLAPSTDGPPLPGNLSGAVASLEAV
jgi:hypothetical protein